MKDRHIMLYTGILLGLSFLLFSSPISITGHAVSGNFHRGTYSIGACADSDSTNFFTRGKVSYLTETFRDQCHADNYVVEYYCEENALSFRVYECLRGCTDGACNTPFSFENRLIQDMYIIGDFSNRVIPGEFLGEVADPLTAKHLRSFEERELIPGVGRTTYNQVISFDDVNVVGGRVLYKDTDNQSTEAYLVFEESDVIFSYKLFFNDAFKSRIQNDRLIDLENEELSVLGDIYEIQTAKIMDENKLRLELIRGFVNGTLSEGEEITFSLEGENHTLELVYLDDDEKKAGFRLNGERIKNIAQGKTRETAEGFQLGVSDITRNEDLDPGDIVEFYTLLTTIRMEDDYTDDSFRQGIEINGERISSAQTRIEGDLMHGQFRLHSITYQPKVETEEGEGAYLRQGEGVKERLLHPEAMLSEWDILYEGKIKDAKIRRIIFDPSSNVRYDMVFNSTHGEYYKIPLVENVNGILTIGRSGQELHFIEPANNGTYSIGLSDYFVLASGTGKHTKTTIFQLENIDTSEQVIVLDDLQNNTVNITYNGTLGVNALADMEIEKVFYKTHVGANGALSIDLNADGVINGSINNIVTEGGAIIDLGDTLTPTKTFDITITSAVERQFHAEGNDNDVITVTALNTGDGVELKILNQDEIDMHRDGTQRKGRSEFGIQVIEDFADNDNPQEIVVRYPREPEVYGVATVFWDELKP